MLVLTRKLGERLIVPHLGFEVAVVGIHGNTVRLGIVAPQEIRVYREEVLKRRRQETRTPPLKG
jgi:carbon storage regulator